MSPDLEQAEIDSTLRGFLDGLARELDSRCAEAAARVESTRADLEGVRGMRVMIQQRCEELERAHNGILQNAAKIASEYERLASLSDRAAIALALTPPAMPEAPRRAIRAIRNVARLRDELSGVAAPIRTETPVCGVYFLLRDNDVVYVGQSINMLSRIATHVTEGAKDFNRWCYMEVARRELDEIEKFYICLLRPQHNVSRKPVLDFTAEDAAC